MRIERLFNVLVLGGAALNAGCSDDRADPNAGGSGGSGAIGGSGALGGSGTGGSMNEAGQDASGAGGNQAGSGGTTNPGGNSGAGGDEGSDASGSGGTSSNDAASDAGSDAAEPVCRVTGGVGDPGDPCGCPCCWVRDCANAEPCCQSFCALANHGAGCCAAP